MRVSVLLFAAAFIPNSILVCPDCSIRSIREAISQATPGSIIEVRGGVYHETPLVIDKSVKLIGRENPVLDAEGKGQIVHIVHAPGIEIRGFEIRNAGVSYVEELAGIRVVETDGCLIEGNHLVNATFGIYLEKSHHCRISNNILDGPGKGDSESGDGIHIWNGGGHQIEKNRVSGHRDGIYFEFVKDTRIVNNQVEHNSRYGLHFMSSNNDVYEDNDFSLNGAGVAVMYSRDIKMKRNRFAINTGPAAYGLLLKEIHSSTIEANSFEGNTTGIFMEGSNRSKFLQNRFEGNGVGLRIMADCESNSFTGNDFIGNSFEVTTNSAQSNNSFDRNYWSTYGGYDLNRDGVADQPYRPVSLSSVILERVDSSYILLNSFLFQLMNWTERALPTLIPEGLKDEHPLMNRQNPKTGVEKGTAS
jgi:nitrous oxidase accessory protein